MPGVVSGPARPIINTYMAKPPVLVTHMGETVTFGGIPVTYQSNVGMRGMGPERSQPRNSDIDFQPDTEVQEQFDFCKWIDLLQNYQSDEIIEVKTDNTHHTEFKYEFLNELNNFKPQPKELRLSLIPSFKKS